MSQRKFLTAAVFVAAALSIFIALIGFVLLVIDKIRNGQGLDYYFTGYGVQMSYMGAMGLLLALPVAILIGWLLNYWFKREERDFEKRFKRKD
jgi:hypothetical protein